MRARHPQQLAALTVSTGMRVRLALVLPALPALLVLPALLAACGSDRAADSISAPATATSPADDGADGDLAVERSVSSLTTTPSEPPAQDCRLLADLEDADELNRWRIANDGVMGGRSSADADVVDSVLILNGEIVTDGGGFSSVRLALEEPLGDATGLLLRVRTDGRSYELTVADALPGRDLRISHQGPIPAVGDGEWEEVAVDFSDLDASIFGQPVDVEPFEPDAAMEVGIILADGRDGPFRFELDWIRACP